MRLAQKRQMHNSAMSKLPCKSISTQESESFCHTVLTHADQIAMTCSDMVCDIHCHASPTCSIVSQAGNNALDANSQNVASLCASGADAYTGNHGGEGVGVTNTN